MERLEGERVGRQEGKTSVLPSGFGHFSASVHLCMRSRGSGPRGGVCKTKPMPGRQATCSRRDAISCVSARRARSTGGDDTTRSGDTSPRAVRNKANGPSRGCSSRTCDGIRRDAIFCVSTRGGNRAEQSQPPDDAPCKTEPNWAGRVDRISCCERGLRGLRLREQTKPTGTARALGLRMSDYGLRIERRVIAHAKQSQRRQLGPFMGCPPGHLM